MAEDRAPTGTEKLQFVAEQLASTLPGQRAVLDCPYCLGRTRAREVFCCETLLKAVTAILEAKEQIEVTEFMDKVIDRHLNN